MIFRRVILTSITASFVHVIYLISGSDKDVDKTLADTLPWVIVALLMLPTARLTTAGFEKLIKIWKGKEHEIE